MNAYIRACLPCRFALNDGEDIADAAQRMIHTIRQRLAVSRTPSEGSVRSRDELEFV